MSAPGNWLDEYIWPQIHSLLLNDAHSGWLYERAPVDGGAFGYGRSKVLGEKELREGAQRLDLSYVICVPPMSLADPMSGALAASCWRSPIVPGQASFCEQKEAKKLLYAGPWALSPTAPQAQHKNKFLRRFFQEAAAFEPAGCNFFGVT